MVDDSVIEKYVQWEQAHRKPSGHFDAPTKGFGAPLGFPADTPVTLWLPSPMTDSRIGFKDGAPYVKEIVGCLSSPQIVELRNNVVRHSQDVGPGLISMGLDFVAYASAVMLMNYDFTDTELELLLGGRSWHKPLLAHVCGGEDLLSTLAEMNVTTPPLNPPFEPPPPRSAPTSAPRGLWSRIIKLIRR
jgi:hypothetical protein